MTRASDYWLSASPSHGSSTGGDTITVTGRGFASGSASKYSLVFTADDGTVASSGPPVAATLTTLQFITPVWLGVAQSVDLELVCVVIAAYHRCHHAPPLTTLRTGMVKDWQACQFSGCWPLRRATLLSSLRPRTRSPSLLPGEMYSPAHLPQLAARLCQCSAVG